VVAEWRGAALEAPPTGAHELKGPGGDAVTELGEVLAGTRRAKVLAALQRLQRLPHLACSFFRDPNLCYIPRLISPLRAYASRVNGSAEAVRTPTTRSVPMLMGGQAPMEPASPYAPSRGWSVSGSSS
jgi:hypothetical protein